MRVVITITENEPGYYQRYGWRRWARLLLTYGAVLLAGLLIAGAFYESCRYVADKLQLTGLR